MCAVSLGAAAQVTYPYNPDGNADGSVALGDLLDVLTVYGSPFSPSEILVEGQTLTTVLTDLQHSIDSLSALSGGGGGSVLDMPLGTILPVASEAVPEGWMLCDGRELAVEDYQDLYDLIGTTYGAGDMDLWAQEFFPVDTFNIPDLRGRTIIGSDDMGGESAWRVSIESYPSIGGTGGSDLDILTQEHLPEISLTFGYPNNNSSGSSNVSYIQGQVNTYQADSPGNPDIGSTLVLGGNSEPTSNMQPYMALNYMIKVRAAEDVIAGLENRIAEIEESTNADRSSNFFSESFNADSLNVVYAHELEVVGEIFDDPIVAVPAGVDVVLCASGKAYIDLSLSDVTRLTFDSYSSSIWQSADIVECPSGQKRLATVVKIQGEWLELK